MPDLPTPGPAHGFCFANTKRRKIVMQHKIIIGKPVQGLDHLFVLTRSQRNNAETLRLPAGEKT